MQLSNLRRLFIILMYFCFFGTTILKAQNSEITVTPLADILGDVASESGLRTAVISPDGETIAWYERENPNSICLYSLLTSQAGCYEDTSDSRWAPTSGLRWSPDSKYIAFHSNFSRNQSEPDIWVFDTEATQFTNYTDDGVDRLRLGGDRAGVFTDILPVWNPQSSSELYFFRITSGTDGLETALYLLNIELGTVDLVQDLASIIPLGIPVYDAAFDDQQVLSGRVSISPDGTQMVFIVQGVREEPRDGIWLLDLIGQATPRQIASLMLSAEGIPSWQQDVHLSPNGLGWLSNSLVVVSVFDGLFSSGVYANLYIIDTKTGDISPLMDFSLYSRNQIFEPDETGYTPQSLIPLPSVLYGNGDSILGVGRSGDVRTLIDFSDLAERSAGTVVYEFPERTPFLSMETASASNDGKAIISLYLVELSN